MHHLFFKTNHSVCFPLAFFLWIQEYVGNEGDFFLFLKNIGAPQHHLVEIDISEKKPGRRFGVVVPVSDKNNTLLPHSELK